MHPEYLREPEGNSSLCLSQRSQCSLTGRLVRAGRQILWKSQTCPASVSCSIAAASRGRQVNTTGKASFLLQLFFSVGDKMDHSVFLLEGLGVFPLEGLLPHLLSHLV
ncbi:hypothetical protein NL108_013357 [Boleophthalmus pectinirostris]|nr:hypothetical protein NL108_013357 [Boleophthalmus pectinirostris]